MANDIGPEDFTGDLGKEENPPEEPPGLTGRLKHGAVAAGGGIKGLYTAPRDKIYSITGARDSESGEIDEGRRNALRAVAGAAGLLAAGAAADKYSDGELDGNVEGVGGIGGFGGAGPPAANQTSTETPNEGGAADRYTETDNPDTPTERPTDTETPTETDTTTDTPTDTQTGTEQSYSGQIDGSNYELKAVPGPVEGEGYQVTDELLEDYDPDSWADIIDEEEYQELGTGADWYLQEDSITGVNEPQQISRTFPGNEFGYDTQELYEDIREEAQS
ncbi:hypothetical protein AQV86_01050 [Nanohaloarchaea archaeon SG9]|nr:hypothetical protein AQV86_01050 [Nanohaloarchaea archaeon SG9]